MRTKTKKHYGGYLKRNDILQLAFYSGTW